MRRYPFVLLITFMLISISTYARNTTIKFNVKNMSESAVLNVIIEYNCDYLSDRQISGTSKVYMLFPNKSRKVAMSVPRRCLNTFSRVRVGAKKGKWQRRVETLYCGLGVSHKAMRHINGSTIQVKMKPDKNKLECKLVRQDK